VNSKFNLMIVKKLIFILMLSPMVALGEWQNMVCEDNLEHLSSPYKNSAKSNSPDGLLKRYFKINMQEMKASPVYTRAEEILWSAGKDNYKKRGMLEKKKNPNPNPDYMKNLRLEEKIEILENVIEQWEELSNNKFKKYTLNEYSSSTSDRLGWGPNFLNTKSHLYSLDRASLVLNDNPFNLNPKMICSLDPIGIMLQRMGQINLLNSLEEELEKRKTNLLNKRKL